MHTITRQRAAFTTALTALFIGIICAPSFAAADAATGIDWGETGTSVLDSAKPAIVAGVVIMGVVLAVTLGRKLFSKVAK